MGATLSGMCGDERADAEWAATVQQIARGARAPDVVELQQTQQQQQQHKQQPQQQQQQQQTVVVPRRNPVRVTEDGVAVVYVTVPASEAPVVTSLPKKTQAADLQRLISDKSLKPAEKAALKNAILTKATLDSRLEAIAALEHEQQHLAAAAKRMPVGSAGQRLNLAKFQANKRLMAELARQADQAIVQQTDRQITQSRTEFSSALAESVSLTAKQLPKSQTVAEQKKGLDKAEKVAEQVAEQFDVAGEFQDAIKDSRPTGLDDALPSAETQEEAMSEMLAYNQQQSVYPAQTALTFKAPAATAAVQATARPQHGSLPAVAPPRFATIVREEDQHMDHDRIDQVLVE